MPLHAGAVQVRLTIRGSHPLAALLRALPPRERAARLLRLAEAGAAAEPAAWLPALTRIAAAIERLAPVAGDAASPGEGRDRPEAPPDQGATSTEPGSPLAERLSARWGSDE